jgi:O-methyltransferase/methyltransferase family protein
MSSSEEQERLEEVIDGYRNTALLYVTAKLGIADLLSSESANANQLAVKLCINANALGRFLRALAAIGIVRADDDGTFSLTQLGSQLQSDAPGSAKAQAILTGEEFLPAWGALLDAIRTGEAQFQRIFGMSAWEHRQANPELNTLFNSWLHEQTAHVANSILRAYDFGNAREIADIGGGHGGLLSAILLAYPHLHGVLIDLAHVAAGARFTLEKSGIIDRCRIQGTDFLEAVPAGSDIYLLKSVLHDWDDARCQRILSHCRQAMAPSSRLLIIERIIGNGAGQDRRTVMLDLHMLVMFGGTERSRGEYSKLADATDLEVVRVIPTDSGFQIIEASVIGGRS